MTAKNYGSLLQPAPVPNGGPDCMALVIADVESWVDDASELFGAYDPTVGVSVLYDMRGRHEAGLAKYKTPLQPNNGRDALADAYQEALDASAYVRQLLEELAHSGFGKEVVRKRLLYRRWYQMTLTLVFEIRAEILRRDDEIQECGR